MTSMRHSWSDYWHSGVKTSFGRDLSANYHGILRDNWDGFWFQAHHDINVLDIGCGNGALTELCFSALTQADLSCKVTGIDYAEIHACEDVRRNSRGESQRLKLQPAEDFTEFTSVDGKFDWLISQFGFEYVPRTAALLKTAQLLKANGQFRFVCHYWDSVFIRENSRQLAMNQFVTSIDAVAKLRLLVAATLTVTTAKQFAEALNSPQFAEFIKPVRELTELGSAQFGANFLSCEFMQCFRFLWSDGFALAPSKRLEILDQFAASHHADSLRLQSMIAAAFTQKQLVDLPAEFDSVGCILQPIEVLRDASGQQLAIIIAGTLR